MSQTVDFPKNADIQGTNPCICMVVDCVLPCRDEPEEILLETKSGDKFLFTARFCNWHILGFMKAPGILASYIMEGKIRGIDPSILKEL